MLATGQGLFEVLQNVLISLDLDIDNVRGHGYDNGSNMKGGHQGVQKKLLDVNRRAFYTPCGSHSLNLTLCDVANSCGKARDFFGVVQRIYTIFANSTKRWHILKCNVINLTLKPLSSTRWESRVESVKAIRYQVSDIREALLQVADTDSDSKIQSEARSLATNELSNFEFLLATVIWFEILFAVNLVSKQLQTKDMLLDNYRENGFSSAMDSAKEIANELEIEPVFPQKQKIRRKRQFDESVDDTSLSPKGSFRVHYFLYIVDQAIISLTKRFEQYEVYEGTFGFLFSSDKLQSMTDINLKSCCTCLEAAPKRDDQYGDIDRNELYLELKLLREILSKEKIGALGILNSLKQMGCFPNATIAYRILLTIPITVASAERSFSKLKLLKSYLRSNHTSITEVATAKTTILEVATATAQAPTGHHGSTPAGCWSTASHSPTASMSPLEAAITSRLNTIPRCKNVNVVPDFQQEFMETFLKRKSTFGDSSSQGSREVTSRPCIGVNIDELEVDPAKRKSIYEYHINDRDIVRQRYLQIGLAFRGHDESYDSLNRGNFLEALRLLANNNDKIAKVVLQNAPENHQMTAPCIQKDIANAVASEVTQVIINDLGEELFGIIVDESRDISVKEQMIVFIRYVDSSEEEDE
ncbi:PREDICTED: uncharacterized protein LOC109179475 [Ipomoea nil]|uniref:uncharacterized protein LOC109179475 n=1 Tax=Ipomoea nil TaxID=35883 RepID=UPI0009009014|nr:PREDICTED: uncharacterized protein LOC109179475 [Ipomoea nil]